MGQCLPKLPCVSQSTRSIPTDINPRELRSFIPPITQGRVIKCYDGDTIHIAAYLPYAKSELYKFSVRVNGIDCPEMKSRDPNEKAVAIIARDKLAERILGKMVKLENVATEKYGRVLADVVHEGLSCGPWLVQQRLAVPYQGKTKKSPENWMEFHQKGPEVSRI
jgi:micrococcal nuclease